MMSRLQKVTAYLRKGLQEALKGKPRQHSPHYRRADFAEFLPDVQSVSERSHSPLARSLILIISGMFLTILLWASFSEVDQVATASGVVRPMGRIKTINHQDGGRISEILVREGDVVSEGDVLARLDPEYTQQEIRRLTNEREGYVAEIARYEAESREADAVRFTDALRATRQDLVELQTALFTAQRKMLDARRTAADRVIEQRENHAFALQSSIDTVKSTLQLLTEQEEVLAESVKKGYYPQLEYLQLKAQIIEQQGNMAELESEFAAAQSAFEEARTQRALVDHEYKTFALNKLEELHKQHSEVSAQLGMAEVQLHNLDIVAPVLGVVQNLAVASSGQSIQSGEAIMNIVPTGDSLVVEAKVSNDDIGYVNLGQETTVKVRTFDFLRYGALEGIVEQIAADATEDKKTGDFKFNIFVRTDDTALEGEGQRFTVQPGMLVDVDFHIGKRSILSYLTDRILHTTTSAFRER